MVESFAAARWIDDDGCWAPLVVVCGPAVAENAVHELLEVGSDPLGGTAVVAVGTRKSQSGAAHSVRLAGGASSAPLELLAAVLSPQQVDAGEFAEVAAILDLAEEKDSAPPSEDPYRDLQVPLPAAQPPAAPPDAPLPITSRGPIRSGRGGSTHGATALLNDRAAVVDREDVVEQDAGALDVTDPVAAPSATRSAPSPEPAPRQPTGPFVRRVEDDPDSRPGTSEVEVLVLGPVEIRGASREIHPGMGEGAGRLSGDASSWRVQRGVGDRALAGPPDGALVPSLHGVGGETGARSVARDGIDHLPRSHGRLALGPTVGTDWDRFVSLADSGRPARWRSALELVRGRPFEGLRSSDWPILEGIGPAIESSVVDLSGRLAGACLNAGDARGAGVVRAQGVARQSVRRTPLPYVASCRRLGRKSSRRRSRDGRTCAVSGRRSGTSRIGSPEHLAVVSQSHEKEGCSASGAPGLSGWRIGCASARRWCRAGASDARSCELRAVSSIAPFYRFGPVGARGIRELSQAADECRTSIFWG